MRKYQQLLIGALGIVSFVCFLIYKHEYDRLRYVMENLSIFGSPPSVVPPPDVNIIGDGIGIGNSLHHQIPEVGNGAPPVDA